MRSSIFFITILFSINSYAIGEWKDTAAYKRCHQTLENAQALCHTQRHTPDKWTRLLLTSDKEHDSFIYIGNHCAEMTKSRTNNIRKYLLNYDSVNNACYFGYVHNPSGKVKMTLFQGDSSQALGTIDYNSVEELEEFIKKPDLKEARTILQESIYQQKYEERRRLKHEHLHSEGADSVY